MKVIRWGWIVDEPGKYYIDLHNNGIFELANVEFPSVEEALEIAKKEKYTYYSHKLTYNINPKEDESPFNIETIEDPNGAIQNFSFLFKCTDVNTGEIFYDTGKNLYDEKIDMLEKIEDMLDTLDGKALLGQSPRNNMNDIEEEKRNLIILKRKLVLEDLLK